MGWARITDEEWAFFSRYFDAERRGRRPRGHRRILDGVFLLAMTGRPWRQLPTDFGQWGTVYRQFRRWSDAGLWQLMLDDLDWVASARAAGGLHTLVWRACESVCGCEHLREKITAALALARRPASPGRVRRGRRGRKPSSPPNSAGR